MRILVSDLEREPLDFDESLTPGAIDFAPEATQIGPLVATGHVEVLHEHRGPREILADIRLKTHFHGQFEVPCARCVEPVEHFLEGDFDLIFRPVGADTDSSEHSISTSETEIGYYQDGGLALEDVLREQVLLSLPVRSLCKPDCKGLCPRCGQNLNVATCQCDAAPADARWTALADIRSRIKL